MSESPAWRWGGQPRRRTDHCASARYRRMAPNSVQRTQRAGELAAENRCVKRATHPIPLSWSQGRMQYITWTRDTLPATRRGPPDCRIRIGEGAGGDAYCHCKQQKIESIISSRTSVDGSVGSSCTCCLSRNRGWVSRSQKKISLSPSFIWNLPHSK